MGKGIKAAVITGVCGIIAGAVSGSLITSTVTMNNSTNNNTNNNTIVITSESGEEEIVTAQDYEQMKMDNQELEEENRKLPGYL